MLKGVCRKVYVERHRGRMLETINCLILHSARDCGQVPKPKHINAGALWGFDATAKELPTVFARTENGPSHGKCPFCTLAQTRIPVLISTSPFIDSFHSHCPSGRRTTGTGQPQIAFSNTIATSYPITSGMQPDRFNGMKHLATRNGISRWSPAPARIRMRSPET